MSIDPELHRFQLLLREEHANYVFFVEHTPIYGILGLLIGGSSSAVRGARLGYRTGHFFLSCKLAFLSAYMSPFNAPMGSKKQQAVDLKIDEALFELAKKQSNVT